MGRKSQSRCGQEVAQRVEGDCCDRLAQLTIEVASAMILLGLVCSNSVCAWFCGSRYVGVENAIGFLDIDA